METGNLAQVASAALGVIGFATAVWSARAKRFEDKINTVMSKAEAGDTALRTDIGRVFQRIDGAEQRLARAENELAHLPNKDMVHSLQLGMAELKGQIGALIERVTPLVRSVDRVEQTLLERNER